MAATMVIVYISRTSPDAHLSFRVWVQGPTVLLVDENDLLWGGDCLAT